MNGINLKKKCLLLCDPLLSTGSAKLNASLNGKIAVRMLVYFVLTSLINAVLGTFLALSIHPGDSHREAVLREDNSGRKAHILDGVLDLGRWANSRMCNNCDNALYRVRQKDIPYLERALCELWWGYGGGGGIDR
jgi:hypothetical protein